MSVVTIQLGQCGNQIGTNLFNALITDATIPPSYSSPTSVSNEAYEEEVSERFFCQHDNSHIYTARAVMVDTEPKVINQCILQAQKSGTRWHQICLVSGGEGDCKFLKISPPISIY